MLNTILGLQASGSAYTQCDRDVHPVVVRCIVKVRWNKSGNPAEGS